MTKLASEGIQYISALILLNGLRSFGFVSVGDGY